MTQTTNMAEDFAKRGLEPPEYCQCKVRNPATGRRCGHVGRAFEFANVSRFPVVKEDYICGGCYQDLLRVASAVGRAMSRLVGPPPGWDSEEGQTVRVQRNELTNGVIWATLESSGLTAECRDRHSEYIGKLNRITVDFPRPSAVEWPAPPSLEYV